MEPTVYRIALAGLGNVGGSLLSILHQESESLQTRYGVKFKLTGVAELGGGAINDEGLDLGLLLNTLSAKSKVSTLPDIGRPGMQASELLALAKPDFLLEATPVNLKDAEPSLSNIRAALNASVHVVLANKGPAAVAFNELAEISDMGKGWGKNFGDLAEAIHTEIRPKLRFSACVAGSLPAINLGWRDLAGCQITRLEAVFNGTTQYIIRAMEDGQSYDSALADAQRRGIAETDPSLDVDGWDAAAKLVIAANSVLGQSTQLSDVDRQGIRDLTLKDLQEASNNGLRMVPVATAVLVDGAYQLSVRPTPLPLDHPLSRLTPDEMGVVYYSRDVDRLSAASSEPGPEPAAAAMLRDMLDIIRSQSIH
ncbi:homoserine dehydrogenase [Leucothrix arctica]|uniref:Homoserine dehydrogenase n=1 Tax=Leucothrix arctica TaxID=1481894 RepID=A0A317CLL2_9GAMM|nr:homoserine dehydrogenase [Leucothrix arctica]PWQ99259.1 homoserine dehydrogenase [Leucothrix arctica]